jgi:hypothetical protein
MRSEVIRCLMEQNAKCGCKYGDVCGEGVVSSLMAKETLIIMNGRGGLSSRSRQTAASPDWWCDGTNA